MRKKIISILSILFLTVIPLTLWAGGEKEAPVSVEKPFAGTKLVIGCLARSVADSIKTLIPDFEEETGIKVVLEQFEPDALGDKLTIEETGGTGFFDIYYLSPGWIGTMSKIDSIRPIDDYMAKYNLDFDDFPATDLFIKYPGRTGTLGFPYNFTCQLLVYRKDLFEDPKEKKDFLAKYGYELKPPSNLQEILDTAEFFTRDLDGDGKIDLYGFARPHGSMSSSYQTILWLIWSHGGEIFNAETFEVLINTPNNVKALEYGKKLFQFEPPESNSWLTWEQASFFKEGKVAMVPNWFSFVLNLLDPEFSDLADVTWAVPQPGKYIIGGGGLAISKHSKNPEASFLFLKWLLSKENSIRWFKAGGPVIRKSTYESEELKKEYPRLFEMFKIHLEAAETTTRSRITLPEAAAFMEQLHMVWFDFIQEKMTAEEVLARTEKNIEQILKEGGYK